MYIKNFNSFNEALGINKDIEQQANDIFKEINDSDKNEFDCVLYGDGYNVFFKLKIEDLGGRMLGKFGISDTGKIIITLSNKTLRSTLFHEMKHIHRYTKRGNDKDVMKEPLNKTSLDKDGNFKSELTKESGIFYSYGFDEFEAKYHSYYMNIDDYIKEEMPKYKSAKKDKVLIKHLIDTYLASCDDKTYQWYDSSEFKFSNTLSKIEIDKLFYALTKKEEENEPILHGDIRDFLPTSTEVMNSIKSFARNKFNIYSKSERLEMDRLKNKFEREINKRKKVFHKKFNRIYTIMIDKWCEK